MIEQIIELSKFNASYINMAKENHLLRCLQLAKPSIRGELTIKKLKNKKIETCVVPITNNIRLFKVMQNGENLGKSMIITNKGLLGIEIDYREGI